MNSDNVHRNLIQRWDSSLILLRTSVIYASYVEMMGLIGAGNNPMVGMTVAVAVAIEEAQK